MKFKKEIISLRAFLSGDREIDKLVEYGNLYPTDNWKCWTDDYGYRLLVDSKRKLKISFGKANPIINGDLYAYAHPKDIVQRSKRLLIKGNVFLFLGFDKKFRCFVYDGGWKRVSPFILPLSVLRRMVKFESKKEIKIFQLPLILNKTNLNEKQLQWIKQLI